ncbi:chlorite dismutase family protein [Microbacterium sp. zg.Y1090]|uniref:hydrogen peroxide-dependent heme synthase n=1 Tax=Microbacterium TaxID=33882 RepID=UPI00214BDE02|nr:MULTISPECIES: hydrogen peroxide-dependent heme synthase [unclassified Microbacterium]MCR2813254.1 chlorite dismutase family protein [Microbacterium sp. zg.Y1084]MCR2819567.1 chlorite dismutase family protein [Microbacterium sp. zg.Y1090]MDL5487421.1 chlorite dismutase family protein [Microbacterium sp. zg-Y1211]WIM28534.1 chlorite dismutase family protein [Microbacterium sp. zg-Y1090]
MSDTAYTLWSVLRRDPSRPITADRPAELEEVVAELAADGTTVRGFYDVSGLRADADLMIWLHGPTAEGLQRDLRRLRRTALLEPLLPTWSAMGVHRDAEFNRAHVPGFLRGIPAKQWLTVYPFVRSYEWYLLPEEERRAMLADHGRKGAAFTGVTANTVASFALGDWEWLLPMEADELTDLVDMMRELRYTEARRHVREEVPFFTGRLVTPAELVEVLR